jgi:hypothetical protein
MPKPPTNPSSTCLVLPGVQYATQGKVVLKNQITFSFILDREGFDETKNSDVA